MFKKHHTTILNFLLITGLVFYLFFIIQNNLSLATISIILFLYVWIIGNIYCESFNVYHLIKVSGCVGVLYAVTYFFMYGIEEVPYPEGAIMFYPHEIALSMIICFISTIIVLFVQFNKPTFQTKQLSLNYVEEPEQKEIQGSEWQEATPDDLESGQFEPI